MRKSPLKRKSKQKSLTSLKNTAWKLFSELIRRSAADSYGMAVCYTCGDKKPWKELQAGHLLDGRNNAILFEENGVRPQCKICNLFKNGNKEEFIPRFIDQCGELEFQRLKALKKTTRKISRQEYEDMIADYKQRLEKL